MRRRQRVYGVTKLLPLLGNTQKEEPTLLPRISPDFSRQPRSVAPAAQSRPRGRHPETLCHGACGACPRPHGRAAVLAFPKVKDVHTELLAPGECGSRGGTSPVRGPARPPPRAPPTRLRRAAPGWDTPDPREELLPGQGRPPPLPASSTRQGCRLRVGGGGTDVRQPGQALGRDTNANPREARLRAAPGAGRTRPSRLPDARSYGQTLGRAQPEAPGQAGPCGLPSVPGGSSVTAGHRHVLWGTRDAVHGVPG